jgi:hypothetical protein
VACASPGNCATGDVSVAATGGGQPIVASENNGTWTPAVEVPGITALPGAATPTSASVSFVSCGATGDCTLIWNVFSGPARGDISVEKNGVWGQPQQVPGQPAGSTSNLVSVACATASPGTCVVGGRAGRPGIFILTEHAGVWGTPKAIPGLKTLSGDRGVDPAGIACSTAGNCVLGGSYGLPSRHDHSSAWTATEKNGTWSSAQHPAGLAALDKGPNSAVESVSCGAPGYCAAVGYYTPTTPDTVDGIRAFLASRVNGTRQQAQPEPGLSISPAGG